MALRVELLGSVTVYPTTSPKEKLSISEISQTETFDEEMLVAGNLDAGSGWYSIPFGVITQAVMLDFKSDIPVNVRLNDSGAGDGAVFTDATRIVLIAELTKIELQRHATNVPRYSAHFFE